MLSDLNRTFGQQLLVAMATHRGVDVFFFFFSLLLDYRYINYFHTLSTRKFFFFILFVKSIKLLLCKHVVLPTLNIKSCNFPNVHDSQSKQSVEWCWLCNTLMKLWSFVFSVIILGKLNDVGSVTLNKIIVFLSFVR